jgi:hypothetical protein
MAATVSQSNQLGFGGVTHRNYSRESRYNEQRPGRDCTGARGQHALLDDLVRAQQQRLRDREAERLGRLEVDYELELGGLLDREVSGLGPFEDLIDIGRGAAEQVGRAWAVKHQTTSIHVVAVRVDRWEPIFYCKFHKCFSPRTEDGAL